MNTQPLIVICGGGGFIDRHLVAEFRRQGQSNLRAVDVRPKAEWHQEFTDVENLVLNLANFDHCQKALLGATEVYNLASDSHADRFHKN